MQRHDLRAHKLAPKHLEEIPRFKAQKKNKLPKPFAKLGGPRYESSGILDVSDDHAAFFYWRNGETLTDRSFYAYLFCKLQDGSLSPVFEFHWHPSHKGIHCKTPCRTELNYTNRTLPGAPELAINTPKIPLDPGSEADRLRLICLFCKSCGISLPDPNSHSENLW